MPLIMRDDGESVMTRRINIMIALLERENPENKDATRSWGKWPRTYSGSVYHLLLSNNDTTTGRFGKCCSVNGMAVMLLLLNWVNVVVVAKKWNS